MAQNNRLWTELVAGFGFLNGLWLAIGINPQTEVIAFLQVYLEKLHPTMKWVFIVLPIIILLGMVFTMFKVYKQGRFASILAVFLAFLAGTLALKMPQAMAALLLAAFVIGWLGFRKA